MEPTNNYVVGGVLGLFLLGVVGIIAWMGILTQNKDKGAEIQKSLTIIASLTGVLVFLFGVAAYVYFTANVNYLTPFLFVLSFVNLFLSIYAVSAASLSVTS